MHAIRLAAIALACGAITCSAVYGQPPGYGPPPGSRPGDGYDRGYDADHAPRTEVGFFYDELSNYGDWMLTRNFGWAWFPRDVPPYWRPYSDGRWVYTDYGWAWASNETFGWATYHYGRWAWDPRFGWLWVPGTVWGPAWVSWEYGGGYVGWAPLPPSVRYQFGTGIRHGDPGGDFDLRPDAYCFVPERSFLQSRVSRYVIPTARNVTILQLAVNITNYDDVDNRVMNRGVDVRRIEQATGQPVQPLRVIESRERTRTQVVKSELRIYTPERRQLESVRVAPRADPGLRPEVPPVEPGQDQPSAQHRDPPELVVAPRTDRAPRPDPRQVEQQTLREQQQLEKYQASQTQKLEQLHQQEVVKARAQADRDQLERRHQAELAAQRQQQQDAKQQLEARQNAQHRAVVLAGPPGPAAPRSAQKPVDRKKQK